MDDPFILWWTALPTKCFQKKKGKRWLPGGLPPSPTNQPTNTELYKLLNEIYCFQKKKETTHRHGTVWRHLELRHQQEKNLTFHRRETARNCLFCIDECQHTTITRFCNDINEPAAYLRPCKPPLKQSSLTLGQTQVSDFHPPTHPTESTASAAAHFSRFNSKNGPLLSRPPMDPAGTY